jgi:hypothetical protein
MLYIVYIQYILCELALQIYIYIYIFPSYSGGIDSSNNFKAAIDKTTGGLGVSYLFRLEVSNLFQLDVSNLFSRP